MGFREYVLPSEIRPLNPVQKLCGSIFTVNGHVEAGADPHQTLLAWTGLLSHARPDTVIACQPNDSTVAHMGELSAEALHLRGIRGYLVDGGCRDTEFILRLGFPVWCRYLTPRDVVGYWLPDGFEIPIRIGRVLIHNEDYALADRDGVVIIPSQAAEDVVAQTEQIMARENLVRKAILEGVDPQQAYLRYGKF
jgi:regulator of RNase E activity RraA